MAWRKKTWIDRLVEFPGRRKLVNTETGRSEIVDVERSEGVESQRGDPFSAETMNDLETRIDEGFTELKKSVSDGKKLVAAAITAKRVAAAATDSFAVLAQKIGKIVLGSGNAQRSDVLSGKTFTNDDGVQYTGGMPDNGAISVGLQPGQSYRVPAGYHNGHGTVSAGGNNFVYLATVGIHMDVDHNTPRNIDVKPYLSNYAALTVDNFVFSLPTQIFSTGGDKNIRTFDLTVTYNAGTGMLTVSPIGDGNTYQCNLSGVKIYAVY